MTTSRRRVLFAAGLGFAAAIIASAQTIQFVTVVRQAAYVQTGATAGDVSADLTRPFQFRATVEGDSAMTASNPWTAVSLTLPNSAAHSLAFDSADNRWLFEDNTQTSMANLNAAYGSGTYSFTPTGTPSTVGTVTVGSFGASLLNVPLLTLSGGAWNNGSYVISNTAALSVTFNAVFSGTPGANEVFHFDTGLYGSASFNGANDFANWDPITGAAANYASVPPVFTIGAGQLATGSYTLEASYNDVQNPAAIYGSAFSASLLEHRTTISVQVVPEPAAAAALLGAMALSGLWWRRRSDGRMATKI